MSPTAIRALLFLFVTQCFCFYLITHIKTGARVITGRRRGFGEPDRQLSLPLLFLTQYFCFLLNQPYQKQVRGRGGSFLVCLLIILNVFSLISFPPLLPLFLVDG